MCSSRDCGSSRALLIGGSSTLMAMHRWSEIGLSLRTFEAPCDLNGCFVCDSSGGSRIDHDDAQIVALGSYTALQTWSCRGSRSAMRRAHSVARAAGLRRRGDLRSGDRGRIPAAVIKMDETALPGAAGNEQVPERPVKTGRFSSVLGDSKTADVSVGLWHVREREIASLPGLQVRR